MSHCSAPIELRPRNNIACAFETCRLLVSNVASRHEMTMGHSCYLAARQAHISMLDRSQLAAPR